MKVGDAYAVAIDCLREHGAETKATRDALKILQKKYNKLAIQKATRAAAKCANLEVFEAIDETLTPGRKAQIVDFYSKHQCEGCGLRKEASIAFCRVRCWPKLTPEIRHAMHVLQIGCGWEGSYEAGLTHLRSLTKTAL